MQGSENEPKGIAKVLFAVFILFAPVSWIGVYMVEYKTVERNQLYVYA